MLLAKIGSSTLCNLLSRRLSRCHLTRYVHSLNEGSPQTVLHSLLWQSEHVVRSLSNTSFIPTSDHIPYTLHSAFTSHSHRAHSSLVQRGSLPLLLVSCCHLSHLSTCQKAQDAGSGHLLRWSESVGWHTKEVSSQFIGRFNHMFFQL